MSVPKRCYTGKDIIKCAERLLRIMDDMPFQQRPAVIEAMLVMLAVRNLPEEKDAELVAMFSGFLTSGLAAARADIESWQRKLH